MYLHPAADRDRWGRIFTVTWSLVGIALLLGAFGWIFGKVASALVPFLLAVVIVFLFRAPVAELERRGIKRGLAVGLCYLVGFAVFGTLLAFLVPALIDQVRQFIIAFPGYYQKANEMVLSLQQRFQTLAVPSWIDQALANIQDTVTKQSAAWSTALAREIFTVGGSAITLIGSLVLALVIAFWVLKDLPIISKEAVLLAGPKRREEASVLMKIVSRILGGYLRGQLLISLTTGAIVATGLTIIGVPYSLVIGLLAAVFNVVPWIGPALTALIAGIAAAFVGGWHILAAVAVCVAAQQVTDYFVQPRVMSQQVDLHPLLVIFSLLVGAALFGLAGVILAIPVAAITKGVFVYFFERYTDSKLTSEDGALFRSAVVDTKVDQTPEQEGGQATDANDADDAKRRPEENG